MRCGPLDWGVLRAFATVSEIRADSPKESVLSEPELQDCPEAVHAVLGGLQETRPLTAGRLPLCRWCRW